MPKSHGPRKPACYHNYDLFFALHDVYCKCCKANEPNWFNLEVIVNEQYLCASTGVSKLFNKHYPHNFYHIGLILPGVRLFQVNFITL